MPPEDATLPATEPLSREAQRLAELRALAEDNRRYLARINPFTDALWRALLAQADDVLRSDADVMRAAGAAYVQDAPASDDPGERRERLLAQPLSALDAIARNTVARAMRGDGNAQKEIADRLEGRPGARKGEVDADEIARAAKTQGVIERIVREMTERHRVRPRPGDDAVPVDATTHVP